MKGFDLDSQLKAVRVPLRPEAYWEEFPRQVALKLRRLPAEPSSTNGWIPRLAWIGGPLLACCLLALCIAQSDAPKELSRLLLKRNEIHQRVAQIPASLRTILRPGHGLESLVADQQ